jgi:hypothetical protein
MYCILGGIHEAEGSVGLGQKQLHIHRLPAPPYSLFIVGKGAYMALKIKLKMFHILL